VIGVISGSLNEGGAIAWAIPIQYFNSASMQIERKPPSAVNWPPLRLMNSHWSSLRRQLSAAGPFSRNVSDMFVSVADAARVSGGSLTASSGQFNRTVAKLRDLVDLVPRSEDKLTLKHSAGYSRVRDQIYSSMEQAQDDNEELSEANDQYGTDVDKFLNALIAIDRQLSKLKSTTKLANFHPIIENLDRQTATAAASYGPKQSCALKPEVLSGRNGDVKIITGKFDEDSVTVENLRHALSKDCIREFDQQLGYARVFASILQQTGASVQIMLEEDVLAALERSTR
jgi:hypothetical protein